MRGSGRQADKPVVSQFGSQRLWTRVRGPLDVVTLHAADNVDLALHRICMPGFRLTPVLLLPGHCTMTSQVDT